MPSKKQVQSESLKPGESLPDRGDGSSTYIRSGNNVKITGYVLDSVAYYLPEDSNLLVDDGRLEDPSVVRWLHNEATVKANRSESSTLRNRVLVA
jgi:hypothetical protein